MSSELAIASGLWVRVIFDTGCGSVGAGKAKAGAGEAKALRTRALTLLFGTQDITLRDFS